LWGRCCLGRHGRPHACHWTVWQGSHSGVHIWPGSALGVQFRILGRLSTVLVKCRFMVVIADKL